MTDELENAVEAAIARQMMRTVLHDRGDRMYLHVARAAIAVALEEAAMRCDMEAHSDLDPMDFEREVIHKLTAKRIAAAIRAMIPKD